MLSFQNYERLVSGLAFISDNEILTARVQEAHFTQAHFACTNSACQAQKFVVFGSALDLKAHQVEVHGAEMSSRDKKDARRVQAEFAFDDAGGSSRRGRLAREREQEPPPALNRPPIRPTGNRREAFGGRLTGEAGTASAATSPSGTPVPSTPPEDTDPVVGEYVTHSLPLRVA